jgi:hypothetical protein
MGEEFNPYPFLAKAAAGDVEALRTLAGAACKQGVECDDLIAFVEALVFSRLAYAATRDPEDAGTTLAILSLASEFCPNEKEMLFSWSAETVALASRLADQGDAFAEQHLCAIVAKCGAEATEAGKDILKMMEGAD